MTTISRVRTEWVDRYHVQMDADASVLDCFCVTLPPYTTDQGVCVRMRDGMSMEDVFREALATLARLRAQPWQSVLPASVFVPFGVITARNFDDVQRECELNMVAFVGGVDDAGHPGHDERVRALCRAADLLGMCGPLEQRQVGQWPPVRH